MSHHRTRSTAALLLVACLVLPAVAAAQASRPEEIAYPPLPELKLPRPQEVVLDNGMVVMLIEDHELPLVEGVAVIRTGGRWEPADQLGVAQLTGTVLRSGGTAAMSADDLDDFLEGRGASVETTIDVDSGSATLSSLAEDFPQVLQVFADVLRRPAFAADRLAVAKSQLNGSIARRNDSPQGIVFREITQIVYGESSPYARDPSYQTVAGIDRDDLVAWHQRYFHPERVILGLVGDFDSAEALALVRQAFGDWPRGAGGDDPEAGWDQDPAPGIYYVEKNDVTQSNIAIAHLGIRKDDPDFYAVEVMNNVLGGSASSRLFSEVRTRQGLAYGVSGSVGSEYDRPGMFLMWMSTKTESTGAGIDALLAEARRMTGEPPSDAEVEKAKEAILSSFVFNFDSPRKTLIQQLTFKYFGYPADHMEQYRRGIEAVTPELVRRAAERHIHPERFAILVVGPDSGMDKPLSSYGEVQPVDISIPEPPAERQATSDESRARGAELIARAVEAMGGGERLDAVDVLRYRGEVDQQTPQGEVTVGVDVTLDLEGRRIRQEASLPFGRMVMVVSGDDRFVHTPQGVIEMPAAQADELSKSLVRDPVPLLQRRAEAGFEAAAVGAGEVAGTAVEQVQVALDGELVTLGVDPDSGRVLSAAYRGRGPGGAPAEVVETYSDFRPVDGLTLAFTSERSVDGEVQGSARVETTEIDPPLDEATFRRPGP